MNTSVTLLLSLLGGLAAAHAAEPTLPLSAGQATAAAIVVVPLGSLRGDGERRLPAQAVVPPAQAGIVGAPLAGTVTAVKVAYGETVKRGQVLARLQGPQVLELQRDFTTARAQAEVATASRRRDEALFADGIVSQGRLATTQAGERQAAALLAEKRAALRLAGMAEPAADGRNFSGQTEARAPFDGVVLDAPVEAGQRVEISTVLFKLGRIAPLWLEIQATPAQAEGLAPGDAVSVSGCKTAGKLTLVAPHMNPATQSLLLRAEFANADGCIRPFQFVSAQIAPARLAVAGTWRVPNGALVRHRGQVWLFAAVADGFVPVAVRVIDESEKSTLVAPAEGETALTGERANERAIAVKGIAALKAAWLGLGAGEAK